MAVALNFNSGSISRGHNINDRLDPCSANHESVQLLIRTNLILGSRSNWTPLGTHKNTYPTLEQFERLEPRVTLFRVMSGTSLV